MPSRGRPSKITTPVDIPATPSMAARRIPVGEYICEVMESNGRSAHACAAAAGVDPSTVDHWMAAGSKAADKHAKGHLLYPQEQRLLDFLLSTRAAHARWAAGLMELHRQVAAGGLMVGKVIEKVDPTQRGADGGPLVIERRVEQAKQLPNVKAIEWELERLAKTEFAPRIEVTGAEGGPVQIDERRSRVSELMGELDAYERGLADAHDRQAEQQPASGNGSSGAG